MASWVSRRQYRRAETMSMKIIPAYIWSFVLLSVIAAGSSQAYAAEGPQYVTAQVQAGALALAENGRVLPLCVSADDFKGVQHAAGDLADDFARVTGTKAERRCLSTSSREEDAILIGTIGHSQQIDPLIQSRKINVDAIRGKWEATLTQVVDHPARGIRRALVIAGSDKRGTIFGIYDLSAQIGVSPWYWWADVPPWHHDALYAKTGRWISPEAAVKYRGIFLNDEAPSLTGWVKATYGNYNHQVYEHVFELLLRLHANYLWPAMWNNAFNEDDPLNPKLADEYGIVMGTSHHEPMLRAQQEWKRHGKGDWNYATNAAELGDFWTKGITRNADYESTITIGMRGDGDKPMSETDDVALLEKIVADQRKIIADHLTPTLKSDPQVWALYKEVQGYYEKGMRVPDDVTLLWCDDNWGNIRRLPTSAERSRSGGAGVYYHFDYVGGPRSYKWLATYPLPKVWEQMNLALHYGADRIWIVNVGDLKPMEMPIEFFLDLARDPSKIGKDQIGSWTEAWAANAFGPEHAPEIADLLAKYTKYNGRRKPEQLEPDTWSLVRDHEADRVEAEWQALVAKAKAINDELPPERRAAYFEFVLYPIEACATVSELYIAAGRNHLYAVQGRRSANEQADEARRLFADDAAFTNAYNHELLNGRWNHMMDQTHVGYTYWNQPVLNSMPAVHYVQPADEPRMGIAVEGSPMALTEGRGELTLPGFDSLNQQVRTIEVFNSGLGSFTYTAKADAPWVKLSNTGGMVDDQQRVSVSINWEQVPAGTSLATIQISQENGATYSVRVRALKPDAVTRASLQGFIEANGSVSIEAEHTTRRVNTDDKDGMQWDVLPDYGETLSAMTLFPVDAPSATDPTRSAKLEYQIYFTDSGTFNAEFMLAPTLNFVPGRGLRFAVNLDDGQPRVIDALVHNTDKDWEKAVSDGVRRVVVPVSIGATGYHTLEVHAIDPGLVLEKIVLRQERQASSGGPIAESYLGPPESFHSASSTPNVSSAAR
jgi:hypothetical protein